MSKSTRQHPAVPTGQPGGEENDLMLRTMALSTLAGICYTIGSMIARRSVDKAEEMWDKYQARKDVDEDEAPLEPVL